MSTKQFSAIQALRKKLAPNKAKLELRWRCRGGKAPESHTAFLYRGFITCRSITDPTAMKNPRNRHSPPLKMVIFILKKAEVRARKQSIGIELGRLKRGKLMYWKKKGDE